MVFADCVNFVITSNVQRHKICLQIFLLVTDMLLDVFGNIWEDLLSITHQSPSRWSFHITSMVRGHTDIVLSENIVLNSLTKSFLASSLFLPNFRLFCRSSFLCCFPFLQLSITIISIFSCFYFLDLNACFVSRELVSESWFLTSISRPLCFSRRLTFIHS